MPLLGTRRIFALHPRSAPPPCGPLFTCALFHLQVVPDTAPGFNVPAFYEDFIQERRACVEEKLARRRQAMPPTEPRREKYDE